MTASGTRLLTADEVEAEVLDAFLRRFFPAAHCEFLRRHGDNDERQVDYDWDDRGFGGDCVYRLQRHVVEHLRHGAPVMNTARAYLANLRVEEAVYKSSSEGQRIAL